MEVWMTISAGVEAGMSESTGTESRSGLIAPQILTSLILLRPFGSSKATSYTNESFKTSARRKVNSDSKGRHAKSEQSFDVTGECNATESLPPLLQRANGIPSTVASRNKHESNQY